MKRGLAAPMVWGTLFLALVLISFSCDQRSSGVLMRLKHQPGEVTEHRQLIKGSLRVLKDDSLLTNSYVESTTDIEFTTIAVDPADSTADLAVKLTYYGTEKQTNAQDTAGEPWTEERTVEYMQRLRPNGKLVDINFESEHASQRPGYLRQYYEQSLPVFPDKPVHIGYSWKRSTQVDMPEGPVEASTTYTVKSLVRERGYDCVVLSYQGLCVIPLEPHTPDRDKEPEAKALLSGVDRITTDGIIYFAYKEGFILAEREKWQMTGDRTELSAIQDTIQVTIEVDYDVDISLVSRETGDSTGTVEP